MLEQYKAAILRLCQLQDDYDVLDVKCSTVNRNKRRARKQLSSLELDREDLREDVKKKLIEKKKEEYSSILDEVKTKEEMLSDIRSKLDSELENISLDRFNESVALDTEILITLSDTFAYVSKEVPEIVGRYEYEYDLCLESLDNLANKCGSDKLCRPVKSKVHMLTDLMEESSDKSKLETVLDKIAGVPKDINFETKYRVIVLGGYLAVIVLAFLNLSFLLLGAIGVGCKLMYDKRLETSIKDKCVQYLEDFKSMYQIMFNNLEKKKEAYIEEEKNRIADKYFDTVKNLKDTLDSLNADYKIKVNSITITEEEIEKAVGAEFDNKFKELNDLLADYDKQMAEIRASQQQCDKDLEEIQDEISRLRDAISEVYWELTGVGSDKVLMKEFFLGFKDYDLISVKHDGNAMAIVYDGESSERNSVLISMFIAQLFTNMLPNVLNISIVDIDYTCRDYSIYNGGVFDLLFNFVTNQDNIKKVIDDLHADLIKRQSEISPIADTIDEFNESMIAKNSFTKEYSFLIFQNAQIDYLKNQKLLQLCRTGRSFGIMPIIFISRKLYNEIKEGNDNRSKECRPLLESLSEYTWNFKHSSLDLEKI